MDLQIQTNTYVPRDYSWLGSHFGVNSAKTATLLIAGATKATHYPNNYIKSGTILAKYTSGANDGLWAPYVQDGSTGLDTPTGIVLDGFDIRYDEDGTLVSTKTVGSVILAGTPIQVYLAKLPGLLLADGTTAYAPVAGDITGMSMTVIDLA